MQLQRVQRDRRNDWPDMTPLLIRQFALRLASKSHPTMSLHLCKDASQKEIRIEMTNYSGKAHLPFIS